MALNLVNVDVVDDAEDASFNLDNPNSVATAVVGGNTLLFVTSSTDDSVSVFQVAADGKLTHVYGVVDGGPLELDGASSVKTAVIGGTTYVFVAGDLDDGVSVFSVGSSGTLGPGDNETDTAGTVLARPNSLATITLPSGTFLFTGSYSENGIERFTVSNAGALDGFQPTVDAGASQLDGVFGLEVVTVAGHNFLVAAGHLADGVSVYQIDANGILGNPVDGVVDGGGRMLKGAHALTSALVGGRTYVFVGSETDGGISTFSIAADGTLTNVANRAHSAAAPLAGVSSLATAVVGGTTYLFAAAHASSAVSAFAVAADGSLVSVGTVVDDASLELAGAWSVTTQVIGASTYLFVAGKSDHGVSVFRLDASGLTINGTAAGEIVDATHAPAGQLLPGNFGDAISGFGGNDSLSGLLGNNTINGGNGSDVLIGGLGRDLLRGQAGRDSFDYNFAVESQGANADTILGFSHGEGDRIDLRTIDATPGGISNAFLFAGAQSFAAFNATHNGGVVRAVAGLVQVDIGGNGTIDMIIKTPGATLHAGDFFL